jgi:flagellum-specific peptidoglycan hydrolase FlgJ
MASEAQILDLISRIAPCAQKAYKELGKIYPSICIGMACVESAYGTAGSCFHNSYLGQKVGTGKTATRYWGGKFFTSKTKEEYTVGVHTTINAAFRSYDSMEQCVFNYYELLNSKLYSGVSSGVPFTTQMQQIKNCGYMTSSTEVNSVIQIILKYKLTRYDNVERPAIGNPYQEPTKNVRLNTRGNDARWLQYELNRVGGYKLIVDGIAGELTITCLKNFQKTHGLVDDGICGPLTRQKLKSI